MGISYSIEGNVVRVNVEGHVSLADVRAYATTKRADPAYQARVNILVDCRNLKTLFSARDLRTIANDVKQLPASTAHVRRALVASADVVFGLLRMYEAFTEGSTGEFRVFREESDATAWLLGASDV